MRGVSTLRRVVATTLTIAVLATVFIMSLQTNATQWRWETVTSLKDPAGDDKGMGNYVYPESSEFQKGVLDLTGFIAKFNRGYGIQFVVNLSKIGGNPRNFNAGFSLQEIQIYVHAKDGVPGSINTYGLNVVVRGPDAWQFAVIAPAYAPPWNAAMVLIYANGTVVKDPEGANISVEGNSIVINIPMKYVKSWSDNMKYWRYFVAVTPFNPKEPFGVMRLSTTPGKEVIGSVSPLMLGAGVAPKIMDLLAPNASAQYLMLKSCNIPSGSPAVVAAVPYAQSYVLPQPVKTATTTVTKTTSTTVTHYEYSTVTTTITKLREYYGSMTWGLMGLVILLAIAFAVLLERSRK